VKQSGWFGKAPVVAAGDFNSNVQWDANRPGRNHTEVVRLFDSHGLISAYHAHHEEKQGAETRPTYYFYRHTDKPFHIDYVFVPKRWKLRVAVGRTHRVTRCPPVRHPLLPTPSQQDPIRAIQDRR
jgi:endonuclease/exonuclease/phosphatase family metal-dependent hydrolase